jgi:hypothetical protein
MRLVQLGSGPHYHRVAQVEGSKLRVLHEVSSIIELARIALTSNASITNIVKAMPTVNVIDYDPVYSGTGEYELDLPVSRMAMVSGTGLTHLGSAKDRQNMHSGPVEQMTDSMKMFHWGVEGGKPAPGQIGIAPEWFYKGHGILRAHNQPLDIPPHAEDGGEEAEIAGIYVIGDDGTPHRIGMAIGNEFSDHKFEKRNYLNLAGSKLRTCSIGPEIVIDPDFKSVPGQVTIERNGETLWTKSILTGEDEMCHSLANIEHHHFKFEAHRKPGDVHVHFYGACSLSFGDGIELLDGDIMQIAFKGFGRPLRNPVRRASAADTLVSVKTLS